MKRLLACAGVVLLCQVLSSAVAGDTNLGGYGELHFNKPLEKGSEGQLDFHRFVLFTSHQFADWVWMYSELEIEHTYLEGGESTGELALEQAYIQLQYAKAFSLRAGIMLVPVGIVNPLHEPPVFNGVERPNVERTIIPSTWRESGIGAVGSFAGGLKYEGYVMAGLDPLGLSGANGIRGARQKAFESSTANWALTGRLDYMPFLGGSAGISGFYSTLGGSIDGPASDSRFWMLSAHALYSRGNLTARGLVAYSEISDIGALNDYLRFELADPDVQVGENQLGMYAEMAYDFLGLLDPESEQRLFVFARLERYDTHAATSGFAANPDYDRRETTLGLTYLPVPQVCLKMDVQLLRTGGDNSREQLNLGVGYNF